MSMQSRTTQQATASGRSPRRFKNFVAAPIAQRLRDQKNLILRQRLASRFRHPPTFEHDRIKLNRSCSFFYRTAAMPEIDQLLEGAEFVRDQLATLLEFGWF